MVVVGQISQEHLNLLEGSSHVINGSIQPLGMAIKIPNNNNNNNMQAHYIADGVISCF